MSKPIPVETDGGVLHIYPEHIVGVGEAPDGETVLLVARFDGYRIPNVSSDELIGRVTYAREAADE